MSKFLTILLLLPSLCFAQLSTHNEYHTSLEGGFNEALKQAGSTYKCNATRNGAYVVRDDASVAFPNQITITCQDFVPTPDPAPNPEPIPDPDPTPDPAPPTTLIEGQDNSPFPPTPTLVKGTPYLDPVYGTILNRVTDADSEPPVAMARNDYSRRQAFNADNTRLIVFAIDGFWHLYDAITLDYITRLDGGPAGDAELQWHPTNPNLFYYLPNNGGMVISIYDITTKQTTTAANFTGRLPWATAARVWTKSEGSPSADGRYWGFMVETSSFASLGLITYDLETDTITGTLDLDGIGRPDHVSMSPSGDYIVPSWDGGLGTVAYTRDFSSSTQLLHKSEHSDIALLANGHDAYIALDYQSSGGDVFWVDLQAQQKTVLFGTYGNSATAIHFSGKAFNKPGWVLASTYGMNSDLDDPVKKWFHDKVFLIELETGRILNVAHAHPGSGDSGLLPYFGEPQWSISRDGTKAVGNFNGPIATIINLEGLY
jgi:hypothetical protein